ncbi:MAG: diaminopimelate epimerase [Calditrichaeota bacterium]|nr:diaminopimelate epimerase [Calditrichota bacterium]
MIRFFKYHGLGNDFPLIDLIAQPEIGLPDADFVRRICDRRFGVGGDGLLLMAPSGGAQAVRMIYFNADGGRAETCFNGLRCIALHAARTGRVKSCEAFEIASDAATIVAVVEDISGKVTTTMPGPIFDPVKVPHRGEGEVVEVEPNGERLRGMALSLSNPHFVVWREGGDLSSLNHDIEQLGGLISPPDERGLFPRGVNLEMARRVSENQVLMAVWERGVGRTLACGSGATATVCAGVRSSLLPSGQPVEVVMAGGSLKIEVPPSLDKAHVSGKATFVYSGELDDRFFVDSNT